MVDVTVYGGKCRYVFDNDGARAYRHGEEWRDCCGDGFILALAQDIEESRHQRSQLREALENVMHYVETDDMRTLDLNKARAALKATEEDV